MEILSEKLILGAADYVILAIMLLISTLIGLYFRNKQKTNENYLLAGKNMPILPVAFSLMATFMPATALMGIPPEMYMFGTKLAFMNIGFILGPIIAAYVFLPIYFKTNVSTSYEYLEKRFGRATRRVLSGVFLFQTLFFSGINLYGPALALSAVTNMSVWTSTILIGIVCTFYCTIGGMKAVLWTDVFQTILMFICILVIVVKGSMDLGGIGNVFKIAYEGGRIVYPTFNLDLSTRYSMYNVILQGLIITTSRFGASQLQLQRQLTVKDLKSSQIATIVSAPMVCSFHLLCCFCGLIFYAHFKTCDPITSPNKLIQSPDQLLPYYISSTMRQYPGLPGLCIAGIFSTSLSSISSSLNTMAAVTYEDIIRPLQCNTSRSVLITKLTCVLYGILSIFITYVVSSMDNLVKTTVVIMGMISGPVLGLFLLAALSTTATEMGANLGVVAGLLFAGCVSFLSNKKHYAILPVSKNCSYAMDDMYNSTTSISDFNFSQYAVTKNILSSEDINSTIQPYPEDNFPVSYMWISSMSLLICVVVGYFGSWIISCIRGESQNVSAVLLSPVRQYFLPKESSNVQELLLSSSRNDTPSKSRTKIVPANLSTSHNATRSIH